MRFEKFLAAWDQCSTRDQRYFVWEQFAPLGWLAGCREVVQQGDLTLLADWLAYPHPILQEIARFIGEGEARMVRGFLLCTRATCWLRQLAPLPSGAPLTPKTATDAEAAHAVLEALQQAALPPEAPDIADPVQELLRRKAHWPSSPITVHELLRLSFRLLAEHMPSSVPGGLPLGFLQDVVHLLLDMKPRQAERLQSLTVLLIAKPREEGVVAELTLEGMSAGSGTIYPVPEQAFVADKHFRQAVEAAQECVQKPGLWPKEWDVRWSLARRGGRPLSSLVTGNSAGGAFALGLAKLCASAS